MAALTPMMQQYMEVKNQYKDCILFYRLGDFYEMFFDDALTASKVLEITLTGRDCGQPERAPMCGVPYHACDVYLNKLIENGFKVAICEQVEDPKLAKGIVKREVIRVVTPGTNMSNAILDETRNNYLMSIFENNGAFGISVHAVLVDVYGEGVLIMGESGIGKSEAALELIKRGHRLVADDVVEIKKVSDATLVGRAPDITRHFIELRGIGIIDVKSLFGVECQRIWG